MNRKGFTLTELIIVIVLVGIMAFVVFPKIDIDVFKKTADVDRFISNVRYAQHESMITGKRWRLKILPPSRYLIDNDSIDDNQPPDIPGEDNPVNVNSVISYSERDEVFFDYWGRPVDEYGNLIEDKTHVNVGSTVVVIEPYSGGIYIER